MPMKRRGRGRGRGGLAARGKTDKVACEALLAEINSAMQVSQQANLFAPDVKATCIVCLDKEVKVGFLHGKR